MMPVVCCLASHSRCCEPCQRLIPTTSRRLTRYLLLLQGMDRFIPARSGLNMDYASFTLGAKENAAAPDASDNMLSPTKVRRRHVCAGLLTACPHIYNL